MTDAANDPGPLASHVIAGVNVREAAEHFGVDENSMRVFLVEHRADIEEAAKEIAMLRIESLGFLEGLLPMSELEEL